MKFIFFIVILLSYNYAKADTLSVLTYNVNYHFINENIGDILDSLDADIICLQETNKKWEEIISKSSKKKYPFILFKHYGTAGGLAILSKYPIIRQNYLKNVVGWFPAWLITVKRNNDIIQLLNAHLKPKLTEKGRIGWKAFFKAEEIHIQELNQFVNELELKLPIIILGDFNENDNGKMMQYLKNKMTFEHALSKFDKKSKTWRWVLLRGRYDHITFNNQLTCIDAKVLKIGKSDHLPVLGKFTLKKNNIP